MINLINKIIVPLETISRKKFYQYILIFLVIITTFFAFLLYRYYRVTNNLTKKIRKVNRLRNETREILDKDNQVEAQRHEVDVILEEQPYFNIKQYFEKALKELSLVSDTIRISEQINDVDSNYTDVLASSKLTGITMKKLTKLLKIIEDNRRVYIKTIEITQRPPRTIDVNLTIATLTKKMESPE